MKYCKRMKRTCSCGNLVTYDQAGRMREVDGGTECLSDNEIRDVLTVLLREWRKRCDTAETAGARAEMH